MIARGSESKISIWTVLFLVLCCAVLAGFVSLVSTASAESQAGTAGA